MAQQAQIGESLSQIRYLWQSCFFIPVAAVLHMPKASHQFLASNKAILLVGGLTALIFQYAGLTLAAILGVG